MESHIADPLTRPAELIIRRLSGPEDARAFRELNTQWITERFAVEPHDERLLADPQAAIIDAGGSVLIAEFGDRTVGCAALVAATRGRYELAKMAVAPAYRGRGFGRQLALSALREATDAGAQSVFLATATELTAARALPRLNRSSQQCVVM